MTGGVQHSIPWYWRPIALWRMTKQVIRVLTPSPPLVTHEGYHSLVLREIRIPGRESRGSMSVDNGSLFPGNFWDVWCGARYYFPSPSSGPKLTSPDEFHEAMCCPKVSRAPEPKSIPNRALKHLPQWAVSFLFRIFNAIFGTQHFPTSFLRWS